LKWVKLGWEEFFFNPPPEFDFILFKVSILPVNPFLHDAFDSLFLFQSLHLVVVFLNCPPPSHVGVFVLQKQKKTKKLGKNNIKIKNIHKKQQKMKKNMKNKTECSVYII